MCAYVYLFHVRVLDQRHQQQWRSCRLSGVRYALHFVLCELDALCLSACMNAALNSRPSQPTKQPAKGKRKEGVTDAPRTQEPSPSGVDGHWGQATRDAASGSGAFFVSEMGR